ncbi:MAG TPA: hypothetical protein VFG69_03400 [Nannocystaceae bacterium]|nr:hypothetical protein [Nannocystaceae bacterium]
MRRIALACALGLSACDGGDDVEREDGGAATKGDDLDGDFPSVDPSEYDFRTEGLDRYDEVVDGQGIAFSDTILGRRRDEFSEIGPHNTGISTLSAILRNFADLAVAFGRDFEAMGFDTCADLDRVDVNRTSERELSLLTSYKVVRGCLSQPIRPELGELSLTPMDVFVPNHLKMDFRLVANGEESRWPNGQRPDEQVASIFTGLLLDLDGGICEDDQAGTAFDGTRDNPCTVEILQDGGPAAFWDLPLNPPQNDVEFERSSSTGRLKFPYLPPPHRPSDAQ